MEENRVSVIEEYYIGVTKLVAVIVMFSIGVGSIGFPMFKFLGCFPSMTWTEAVCFFLFIAVPEEILFFIALRKCVDNGRLVKKWFNAVKYLVVAAIFINYIGFNVVIPTAEFQYYAYYFAILVAFFLDLKLLSICIGILAVMMVACCFIQPMNIPAAGLVFQELLMRACCFTLTMAGLMFLVWFASHYLINAKKEELEKNNDRVQQVLDKVTVLTGRLSDTSKILVNSSQAESASTEELSAISESLLESNRTMLDKSSQSRENLSELEKSNQNVLDKMKEVDEVSQRLVSISASNETALNHLMSIREEVETSTRNTLQVTDNLLKETGEIGQTLNIINDIAESINLLALNASIEAARAGEAGRGFAVVASEVGNLANNTAASLQDVNEVVNRIQNGTAEVARFMNGNADQLMAQNKEMVNTVTGIRDMITLLKQSAKAIGAADALQKKQAEIIGLTVDMNEDIAESIDRENGEFANITQLVQNNTEEIGELVKQIDILNEMVAELEEVLA